MEGILGVGLEPFHRAHAALVSERVGIDVAQIPLQPLHDQQGAGLDLVLVGIAGLLHITLGHAVGTEEHVGPGRVAGGTDLAGDQASHGVDVAGVVIPTADAADRQPTEGRITLTQPLQFPETGAARADRELGIKRQHHHLLHAVGLDVGNGRFGEGMPVAHRHVGGGLHAPLAQGALQFAGLLLRDPPQGGTAADRAIGRLGLAAAQGADQPSQGLLEGRDRQPDDLRIGEQVVEEGPHVLDPFRPAEVQKHHPDPGHNPVRPDEMQSVTLDPDERRSGLATRVWAR